MTRLAVLSDIHANLPALEAVMQDMAKFNVDSVIVAGDVLNFGPFINQTVERLLDNRWAVLRGNAEIYLLDHGSTRAPQEWNDPVRYPVPLWLNRALNPDLKNAIATWPDALSLRFSDAPPIRVVHATPQNHWDSIYPTLTDEQIAEYLAGVEEETFITGHTHLPLDRQSGKWHLLNPGSVGVPLDGQFSASYMLLQGDEHGWKPTFRRVAFDYAPIYQEFKRLGFVEEYGVVAQLIIEVFKTARPQFGFLSWQEENCPNEPLSLELLAAFYKKHQWWEYANPAYHINL